MHKNAGGSYMLGDFWVPMINCFKGSASGYNQNFCFLNSWPTGRISGGNVNGVVCENPTWIPNYNLNL